MSILQPPIGSNGGLMLHLLNWELGCWCGDWLGMWSVVMTAIM